MKKNDLPKSLLRYLRCIYILSQKRKVVRVKEIALRSNVTTSAATQAIKELAKRGLILHEHYGFVELTEKGEKIARELYERAQFFINFFTQFLNIPHEIAEEDACKMINTFNSITLEKFKTFIEKIKKQKVLLK